MKKIVSEIEKPEDRLRAIKIYCLGVKEDFPQAVIWMNNILHLSGFDPNGEPLK